MSSFLRPEVDGELYCFKAPIERPKGPGLKSPNMASRAKTFFEQLINSFNPIEMIQQMLREHRQEGLFLEFKTPGDEKSWKPNWSVALSGFGNTEGGVVIWGVRAERVKTADGSGGEVDSASLDEPVDNPLAFAQKLRDVELEAVADRIPGVEIKGFQIPSSTKGYVVCYIPEGTHKPYRAEMESKQQYWQRIGDKFVTIPHALLRSLFYPHAAAAIELIFAPSERGFFGNVVNTGTATADALFITCEYDKNWVNIRPNGLWQQYTGKAKDGMDNVSMTSDSSIHPGQDRQLLEFVWQPKAPGTETIIRFAIFARNQEPLFFAVHLTNGGAAMIFPAEKDAFKTLNSGINPFPVHYRGGR
jgi:hypothetical protein